MRAVLTRVNSASVAIDGEVVGKSEKASSSFSVSAPTIPKRNAGIWRKKRWDSGFLPTKTTK